MNTIRVYLRCQRFSVSLHLYLNTMTKRYGISTSRITVVTLRRAPWVIVKCKYNSCADTEQLCIVEKLRYNNFSTSLNYFFTWKLSLKETVSTGYKVYINYTLDKAYPQVVSLIYDYNLSDTEMIGSLISEYANWVQ